MVGVWIGRQLPALGDPTIISNTTWTVLIVVTVGLLLSFTPVRNLEKYGASATGYGALYLLVGAIGAQADLRAVLDAVRTLPMSCSSSWQRGQAMKCSSKRVSTSGGRRPWW